MSKFLRHKVIIFILVTSQTCEFWIVCVVIIDVGNVQLSVKLV